MSGTFSTMMGETRAHLPSLLNAEPGSVAVEHCPDVAGIEVRRAFRGREGAILVLRARLPYSLAVRAKDGPELAQFCKQALEDATRHFVTEHPAPMPPIDDAKARLEEIVRIVYGPQSGPFAITDLVDRIRERFK